jgi:Zn-dependent M16 (insulinase) family peptidase
VIKALLLLPLLASALLAQSREATYANLTEGQTLRGFRALAVYLDDSGRPMGARFQHIRSGFTLDLLAIQSVPQAFIWVTTYPTSNMGEPHTQEHLLLGKGNKGRLLGSQEPMSLVTSSAFTEQWMTCYHFYTTAGPDVFYDHFERTMDALLHPDYSDEEVRREVRNFGVSTASDGKLQLEEKGTVYNEMTTSMDQPAYRIYRAASLAIYGPESPLSFESGGLPEALRVLKPADIRKFHQEHYFLGNMGLVASLPTEMKLDAALAKLDATLNRLEPRKPSFPIMTEAKLPKPQPAPAGRVDYVRYPSENEQQPGTVMMLWPAERQLNNRELDLFSLFLDNVAGDSDTNLYKLLIDSKTRAADYGAKGVSASVDTDQGHPVYVVFRDVPQAKVNDQDLSALCTKVMEEFARIAAYPDGSPELAEFNRRVKGRILERRRDLAKFVNSPPGFGFRGIGAEWIMHLYQLNKDAGFKKSVTQKEELDEIEKLVAAPGNLWRDRLAQWKVLGVTPWIEAAKPDSTLTKQEEQQRAVRATDETERLKEQYGLKDDQQAIQRYEVAYDAATKVIDAAGAKLAPPKFVDKPPMTLDDQLDFKTRQLAGNVPLVTSTFGNMSSATTGIALRLDGVSEDQLALLSMLPSLLTRVGVIENGKLVSYEEMSQRLRNEILSLNASFSTNSVTDRYELVVRGAGNNVTESRRALEWMKLALFHPDWRPENLPRIRDLVEQTLGNLRNTMQRSEESWVDDPARAWRRQDNPLLLTTGSFLTREHNVFRLQWMLKDGGAPDIYGFLDDLAKITGSRDERKATLTSIIGGQYPAMQQLSASSKILAAAAARDLDAMLADLPEASLAADWSSLCLEMRRDLETGPRKTLAALDTLRLSLLATGGARMFLIGSPASQESLNAGIEEFPALLNTRSVTKATYRSSRRIEDRIRARDSAATHPVFVGLLNANSQGGVFLNSSPGASYRDTDPNTLLDYVASNLYAGHGAHGLFMKTWAAGLAYSNGIRIRPLEGRLNYYAERTPLLPQTMQFVIDEVKKAKPDPALVDYAIAGAFDGSRSASSYEDRGESMAADLADGLTPAIVERFHRSILALKARPDLATDLFRRMPQVYAHVLPGMGVKGNDVTGGVFFVIGPEKQLSAYEEYLKKTEGSGTMLFRLYPRDFWLE